MSKISLSPSPTGSAVYTIASPAGSTDRTLTLPDAAGTLGLAGAAVARSQLPAGSVLQVVQANYDVSTTTTSATLADTGLTASITPSSATSKILVVVHQNGLQKAANNTQNDIRIELFRGATNIAKIVAFAAYTNSTLSLYLASASISYLDSPNTTSSVTYKTQFANPDGGAGGGTVVIQNAQSVSTITLMEIAA